MCGRVSGAARGRRNSSRDQTPSPTGHQRQNKPGSHRGAGSRAGEKIQFPPLFLDYYFLQGVRRRGSGRERAINHRLTEEKGEPGLAAGGGDPPEPTPLQPALPGVAPRARGTGPVATAAGTWRAETLQTGGNGGFIYGRGCNPSTSAAPQLWAQRFAVGFFSISCPFRFAVALVEMLALGWERQGRRREAPRRSRQRSVQAHPCSAGITGCSARRRHQPGLGWDRSIGSPVGTGLTRGHAGGDRGVWGTPSPSRTPALCPARWTSPPKSR